jgi:hypothetical protein
MAEAFCEYNEKRQRLDIEVNMFDSMDNVSEDILHKILYYVPPEKLPLLRHINKFWNTIILKYYPKYGKIISHKTFVSPNLILWCMLKKYHYHMLFKCMSFYGNYNDIINFYDMMAKNKCIPNLSMNLDCFYNVVKYNKNINSILYLYESYIKQNFELVSNLTQTTISFKKMRINNFLNVCFKSSFDNSNLIFPNYIIYMLCSSTINNMFNYEFDIDFNINIFNIYLNYFAKYIIVESINANTDKILFDFIKKLNQYYIEKKMYIFEEFLDAFCKNTNNFEKSAYYFETVLKSKLSRQILSEICVNGNAYYNNMLQKFINNCVISDNAHIINIIYNNCFINLESQKFFRMFISSSICNDNNLTNFNPNKFCINILVWLYSMYKKNNPVDSREVLISTYCFNKKVFKKCIKYGSLDNIKWLLEIGVEYEKSEVLIDCVCANRKDIIDWLYVNKPEIEFNIGSIYYCNSVNIMPSVDDYKYLFDKYNINMTIENDMWQGVFQNYYLARQLYNYNILRQKYNLPEVIADNYVYSDSDDE